MALIIEHGGGGEERAIDAMASFGQGYQRGHQMKAEEERRKAAEARAAAMHKLAAQEGRMRLDVLPQQLRLEQEAQELKNRRQSEEIESQERLNRIGNATESTSIKGINLAHDTASLNYQKARAQLREVKKNLRNNAALEPKVRAVITERLKGISELPGAEHVLGNERLEALVALAMTPGAGESLKLEFAQIEAEIHGRQQQEQKMSVAATILGYKDRVENATDDPESTEDTSLLLSAEDYAEALELIESNEDPASVLKSIHDRHAPLRKAKLDVTRYDSSVADLLTGIQTARAEAQGMSRIEKQNRLEQIDKAQEMLIEMTQNGKTGNWETIASLIETTLDPTTKAAEGRVYNAGYQQAMEKITDEMNRKFEDLLDLKDELEAQVEQLKAAATSTAGTGPAEPNYGSRPDGTPKGPGYLGEIKMTDGSGRVMTEMSITVGAFDLGTTGKDRYNETDDVSIPVLVPTLSKSEIDHLAGGGEVTDAITTKAIAHARKRIKQNRDPFAADNPAVIKPDDSDSHWQDLKNMDDDSGPLDVQELLLDAVQAETKKLKATGVKMSDEKLVEYLHGAFNGRGIELTQGQLLGLLNEAGHKLDKKDAAVKEEADRGSQVRMTQGL